MESLEVAKYILQKSTKGLSNLELQQILYLSETNYHKKYNSHLISEEFEIRKPIPILKKVYDEYRLYGANSIDIPQGKVLLDDKAKEIVDKTIEKCNQKGYWRVIDEIKRFTRNKRARKRGK